MLTRTVAVCEGLFEDILIVTAAPEASIETQHKVVHDIIPDSATLGGIYTGLSYASLDYGFVVACGGLARGHLRVRVDLEACAGFRATALSWCQRCSL